MPLFYRRDFITYIARRLGIFKCWINVISPTYLTAHHYIVAINFTPVPTPEEKYRT